MIKQAINFCIRRSKICLVAAGLVLSVSGYAQQLAFPGAEGFGRFATGGRGGEVYYVTNLDDSGSGSLRDALSKPNRTVLFKVSGTIFLKSPLIIGQDNITIAGQSAPGDGICVAGYSTVIKSNNLIVRYIRFRLGDVNRVEDDAFYNSFPGPGKDAFSNIIIDHCSMSWAVDEAGSFYVISDFTLQWSIVSESLSQSYHAKGKHGYGGIWGGANATFHHNLLAHHTSRNPRFSGSFSARWPERELVDLRNNVIYNWGHTSVYGGEEGRQNMVNNYFKAGPATPGGATAAADNIRNQILKYYSYVVYKHQGRDTTIWAGKFFIDGNYVHGYPEASADNWKFGVQPDGYSRAQELMLKSRQDQPFAVAPVKTQTAGEAFESVLRSAGATLPRRDIVDRRIVEEVRTGKATYEGRSSGTLRGEGISHPTGIIDSQSDVGGWPDLKSGKAPLDSDADGMPDVWEVKMKLNPRNPEDRNKYSDSGYTMLEVYLNGIS